MRLQTQQAAYCPATHPYAFTVGGGHEGKKRCCTTPVTNGACDDPDDNEIIVSGPEIADWSSVTGNDRIYGTYVKQTDTNTYPLVDGRYVYKHQDDDDLFICFSKGLCDPTLYNIIINILDKSSSK